MIRTPSQYAFVRSIPTILVGLLVAAVAGAEPRILDTFSSGSVGSPPVAPEAGSRTESGGAHEVVDLGGGDRRLRSTDSQVHSGFFVGWSTTAEVAVGTMDSKARIETGGIAPVFRDFLVFCLAGDDDCFPRESVRLRWNSDGKLRLESSTGVDLEVGAFSTETDYDLRWRFDTATDQFDLTLDGATLVAERALGFDASYLHQFEVESTEVPTGSRLTDDVRLVEGWVLFEDGFEGGGTAAWALTMPPPPPGDGCDDPIALPFAEVVTGDLADNTGGADDDSCGSSNTIDEWYQVETTCAGLVTVTTCVEATEFDTILSAFDACGGSEVACNDDSGETGCDLSGPGSKSTISWAAGGAAAYLVRVTAYSDQLEGSTGFGILATEACF